jgi:hypothetical protein
LSQFWVVGYVEKFLETNLRRFDLNQCDLNTAELVIAFAFRRPNEFSLHRRNNGKENRKENAKKRTRNLYTKAEVKELRAHSKARTPVKKIVKAMKRSEGSLRQKALALGIGLGHLR